MVSQKMCPNLEGALPVNSCLLYKRHRTLIGGHEKHGWMHTSLRSCNNSVSPWLIELPYDHPHPSTFVSWQFAYKLGNQPHAVVGYAYAQVWHCLLPVESIPSAQLSAQNKLWLVHWPNQHICYLNYTPQNGILYRWGKPTSVGRQSFYQGIYSGPCIETVSTREIEITVLPLHIRSCFHSLTCHPPPPPQRHGATTPAESDSSDLIIFLPFIQSTRLL